jgi:predicted MPP superfamily phosphohydrolase
MGVQSQSMSTTGSKSGPRARRFAKRINPFLLIVSTVLVTGYLYIGSQLFLPLELDALPTLGLWLLLTVPFGFLVWLPAVYWRKDEPTPSDEKLLRIAHACMAGLSFILFFIVLREALFLAARFYGLASGFFSGAGFVGGLAAAASGWIGGPSRLPAALLDYHGTLLILGLSLISLAVGYRRAMSSAVVTEVDVPIQGLPESLKGLRIAQISDLHIGSSIRRPQVEDVVRKVNALKPDLIAMTGDIADGMLEKLIPHFEPLKDLSAPLGRFYVPGNHEYYWEAGAWISHIRESGITTLLNSHTVIERGGAQIVVAGVLDLWAARSGGTEGADPAAALRGAPAQASVRILLAHQPKVALAAASLGYDLQLSGHTHGGQFLPWTVVVRLFQPWVRGLHRVGRMWLYVNQGTGYWGPPVRLGTSSEITLLRLV